MESILARALEYTLKYWLKSFSREQFKLQGRTVQLSNLDINGDALHASVGLPPALNVTTAKVGKLEIMLPSVSSVQIEPIFVQIDRLDLVLKENSDYERPPENHASITPSSASSKGSGYGFADKISDGMTIQIQTVNLLLETHGGARPQGGAAWAPPMASVTIRNLLLYTTNESWEVVNLKEAREFSSNTKYIYKLEWESLSIDLLPHPDMFTDDTLGRSQERANMRDDDGAKRVFFGGERFLEGISGEAYITIQRTVSNSPLGLEVQLHITEALCPALSEPGLRALLRFMTGLSVCLNRGDVNLKAQKRSTEAAGRSLVSVVVDHIFICIKDSEFQLELLMQSLFLSRASLSEGENDSSLTRITIAGLFLSDKFSHPPCTLVQPSMHSVKRESFHVPEFARSFCPPIYPLGEQQWQLIEGTPLICLHSLQIVPSPLPPVFASQTVIDCQPLMIHLQEEACLRISSFLADRIVVNSGDILPDSSVNSLFFTLSGLDIMVPLDKAQLDISKSNTDNVVQTSFAGARLHIEDFSYIDSPSMKLRMLKLDKDPACFCLWEGQPIDASQRKWSARAAQITLSLEACTGPPARQNSLGWTTGLWRCVVLKGAWIEVAMTTADGSPLLKVPPPGGIVRVGVACEQFLSNSSVEQLFFILDLYVYFGRVSEKIAVAGKRKQLEGIKNKSSSEKLMDITPSDSAVSLAVKDLQLRFLESSPLNVEGMPLVQFVGNDLLISATHRTFGGVIVISSTSRWESVQIDCVDAEKHIAGENGSFLSSGENIPSSSGDCQLRTVFWIHNKKNHLLNRNAPSIPFLDVNMVHVIPLGEQDTESHCLNGSASVSGIRLGGGMNYAEVLLHQFGILGPDGGPGKGLCKGLEKLQAGPLATIFKTTPPDVDNSEDGSLSKGKETSFPKLKKPDNVDITIELRDWLFALEGAQEMAERWCISSPENVSREERCWHTTFQSLQVITRSSPKNVPGEKAPARRKQQYPVERVTVGIQGLQIMKPQRPKEIHLSKSIANGAKEVNSTATGICLQLDLVSSEDNVEVEMANWEVENLKFTVKQPIEVILTSDEAQHLTFLCKSEVDSMGRIAAGILRVLKLEGSVGHSVMDQLGNLGSEGIDKIFSPKHSRDDSVHNRGFCPSPKLVSKSLHKSTMEPTLTLLEEAVADSQEKINALISDFGISESSGQQLTIAKELGQKIESMEGLLKQLRNKT
ncbi:uncharacterized protein [Arachis hypogaea]|uniref:uncharacterized protein isoform X2 n=1 Tax=Arachis hypogaea TaxID=3818 RepID=UPI000DECDFD8|nr:uncharacterized protein LOC112789947 isoform X3 [Arachis hypogaea]